MIWANARALNRQHVLTEIRSILCEAGIDEFIYEGMENDILKGNFDVIYLDDRLVYGDKKREKVQKRLDSLRIFLNQKKKEGYSVFQILFQGHLY